MLEEIAIYVQKNYNSNAAKMIKDVERPTFDFPLHPIPRTIRNPDGTFMHKKMNEIDIYVWKKD